VEKEFGWEKRVEIGIENKLAIRPYSLVGGKFGRGGNGTFK
jgi:hypothetical protein